MPSNKPTAPAPSSGGDKQAKKPSRSVVEPPKKSRNIPVVGIAFGVIAILLVAAVTLGGNTGPGGSLGEPTVDGNPLTPFRATAGDDAIGLQAPVITGEDFNGEAVTIGQPGNPTAVAFLAHWCSHCQAEVPRVQAWLDGGGGVDGVDILSVSTAVNSARGNYPPSEWLDREGWEAPVLLDDSNNLAHLSYGGGGFPYWVFLNADGTVAARSAGELDIATLEAFMQTIAP
jgi:thiol-disulfide isomerase/thioredoxin